MPRHSRVGLFIVGAQKSGTTALHAVLSRHAALFMPRKELHFFDRDAIDWCRPDYERYEAAFARAAPGQICGDATPAYCYWPNSIERLATYNPAARLILVLRNPVDRAWSAWKMEVGKRNETLSFSEAVRGGRKRLASHRRAHLGHHKNFSYVERGFYARQLARIQAYFPKEQTLVLLHDDMRRRPDAFLARIATFLGIDAIDAAPLSQEINPPDPRVELGSIEEADADYLRSLFREDVRALRAMIEDDVSVWGIA